MKKIVVTGPESTGKSTLCKNLSESLFTPFVKEFARQYLETLNRKYVQDDLLSIAEGQLEIEKDIESFTPSMLFCDTDLLTIKIWSEFKYGNCDAVILNKLNHNLPDLYILCYPDFEWVHDALRENKNDREELFLIYEKEIQKLKVPYITVKGTENERLETVLQHFKNKKY